MRPKERRETGQTDLFRARLDQLVDLQHPLAKLARTIDWGFLEERFGAVYRDGPGEPPLATRKRFRVYVAGRKRGLSAAIKRAFRRRAAVEPVMPSQKRAPHGPQSSIKPR